MLDPETGLDPPEIKLRPANGMEAADYLLPGYWVWARVIEHMAQVGYDTNNMYMFGYDWRLGFPDIERRDSGFSKLKFSVEVLHHATGQKVVIAAHSMGGPLLLHFFNWAESSLGGNGGDSWVNDHVHAVIGIGSTWLGTPKAVSACLSGEMRDTAHFGPLQGYLVDNFFSKAQRRRLFHSWGSIGSLLPVGGNGVWGDDKSAPDDFAGADLNFTAGRTVRFDNGTWMTMDETMNLLQHDPVASRFFRTYSFGGALTPGARDDMRRWGNPLETPLPRARNLTIYCLYGVGKNTERAYHYSSVPTSGGNGGGVMMNTINTHVHAAAGNVTSGVQDTNGDGTVPLVSLGYMCVDGWPNHPELNPSGIRVVTKEYKHNPFVLDLRGGQATGDHVDIMGNAQLLADVLHIATGHEENFHPSIVSNVEEIARRVKLPKAEGN
eukprot:TRINITY_DN347_c0_g3_i10.p1 TRINITY_DN347_c0_g3~~TRINITY_DN347_c0_g3_i10.p1  ORF type:complete len:437 (+),score=95.63 TRINITY_DN347_c0_g3_i10:795-2105(+)